MCLAVILELAARGGYHDGFGVLGDSQLADAPDDCIVAFLGCAVKHQAVAVVAGAHRNPAAGHREGGGFVVLEAVNASGRCQSCSVVNLAAVFGLHRQGSRGHGNGGFVPGDVQQIGNILTCRVPDHQLVSGGFHSAVCHVGDAGAGGCRFKGVSLRQFADGHCGAMGLAVILEAAACGGYSDLARVVADLQFSVRDPGNHIVTGSICGFVEFHAGEGDRILSDIRALAGSGDARECEAFDAAAEAGHFLLLAVIDLGQVADRRQFHACGSDVQDAFILCDGIVVILVRILGLREGNGVGDFAFLNIRHAARRLDLTDFAVHETVFADCDIRFLQRAAVIRLVFACAGQLHFTLADLQRTAVCRDLIVRVCRPHRVVHSAVVLDARCGLAPGRAIQAVFGCCSGRNAGRCSAVMGFAVILSVVVRRFNGHFGLRDVQDAFICFDGIVIILVCAFGLREGNGVGDFAFLNIRHAARRLDLTDFAVHETVFADCDIRFLQRAAVIRLVFACAGQLHFTLADLQRTAVCRDLIVRVCRPHRVVHSAVVLNARFGIAPGLAVQAVFDCGSGRYARRCSAFVAVAVILRVIVRRFDGHGRLGDLQGAVLDDFELHIVAGVRRAEVLRCQTHRIGLIFIGSAVNILTDRTCGSLADGNVILCQAAVRFNANVITQIGLVLAVINQFAILACDLNRCLFAVADNTVHVPLRAGILQYVPVDILRFRIVCDILFCQFADNLIVIWNDFRIQIGNNVILHISARCSGDAFRSVCINNPFGKIDIIPIDILCNMLIILDFTGVGLVRDFSVKLHAEEQLAFGHIPDSVKRGAVIPHGIGITWEKQSIMIGRSVGFILIEILYACPADEFSAILGTIKRRKNDHIATLGLYINLGSRSRRQYFGIHLRRLGYSAAIIIQGQKQIIILCVGRRTKPQPKTRFIAACLVHMVFSAGLYVNCGSCCASVFDQVCLALILSAHGTDIIVRVICQCKKIICSGKMPHKNRLRIS